MMNKALSVVFMLVVLSAFGSIAMAGEQPAMLNADLSLTAEELERLPREAMEGSGEAGLRLFSFYQFLNYDRDESLFWLRLAAEHGSPKAQYNVGQFYKESKNPKDVQKAKLWLQRAADQGYTQAAEALKRLKD